jgi:hypothetical protein
LQPIRAFCGRPDRLLADAAFSRNKIIIMRFVFFIMVFLVSGFGSKAQSASILTGARQMNLYLPLLEGKSVAVFANATSMIGPSHLVDTLLKKGITGTWLSGRRRCRRARQQRNGSSHRHPHHLSLWQQE